MEIANRIRTARKALKLTQTDFGNAIGMKQAMIGQMENGNRSVTDRTILLICNCFSINETWLRTGEGDMFIQSDYFSLDEYAVKKGLTNLELKIIRGYMELDVDTRKRIISIFKSAFSEDIKEEREIDTECENYRRELEAELLSDSNSEKNA